MKAEDFEIILKCTKCGSSDVSIDVSMDYDIALECTWCGNSSLLESD